MENENSICFISRIKELIPINNADKIEQCICDGWSSVVQKGIHKVDNLVLCITNDAIIPEELAIKWGVISYLRKGNRVRTIKLKGVYSECILIPIEYCNEKYFEGEDLEDEFGIYKYEPPAKLIAIPGSNKKVKFQDNREFRVYYKFPNCKNVPDMFTENDDVVVTRKYHGTNFRCGIVPKIKLTFIERVKKFFGVKINSHYFTYGSHNVNIGDRNKYTGWYGEDIYQKISKQYGLEDRMWNIFKSTGSNSVELYGEIIGKGIQGQYDYGMSAQVLRIFDLQFDGNYMSADMFFNREITFLEGIFKVDVLYQGKWDNNLQRFNKETWSNGKQDFPVEGIVVKDRYFTGKELKAYKMINPEYLIFSEKHNIEDGH